MKLLLPVLLLLILFSSCRKENKITTDPAVKLRFSTDTILFDTVFTATGSTSRRLKVYNPDENAVLISNIELAGENTSSYQININGRPANAARNIELAGKDSLNIFIRVLISPGTAALPFIVADSLKFLTNGNEQFVQLRAYGQNAVFYNNETLRGNQIWTDEKPYVIYNSLLIAKNAKLSIQKGARVYFHKNAKLLVAGTLQSLGDENAAITFSGDRLEAIYSDEPGQWQGVHFLASSTDNIISHTNIKNALAAIRVDSLSNNSNPKLILNSSVIKNMQVAGLIMFNAELSAFNNLIFNCGQFLVFSALGGKYNFKQNTFAGINYNFNRQNPALYFADYYQTDRSNQSAALELSLVNNIIWGSNENELLLDRKGSFNFNVSVRNNLLKTKNEIFNTNGNLLNADPLFLDPAKGSFMLSSTSPGVNKGLTLVADPYFSSFLAKDLKGRVRIFPSELGCYENP